MTLLDGSLAPSLRVGVSYLDNLLNLLDVGLRHLAYLNLVVLTTVEILGATGVLNCLGTNLCGDDIWFVCLRLLPLLEYLALPFLVALAVEVGVGLVLHLVHRRHWLIGLQTVLLAMRLVWNLVLDGVCILKLLLQEVPCLGVGLEVERVGEEVVGSSVLIHTTHEIRHGVEEVLVLHHRSIENHVVAQLRLSAPYVVGHTLEHLEAECLLRGAIFLSEQVSV